MQSLALDLVELVSVVRKDELDLRAFWQIDRLVQDQASVANLGLKSEPHW